MNTQVSQWVYTAISVQTFDIATIFKTESVFTNTVKEKIDTTILPIKFVLVREIKRYWPNSI